MTSLLLRQTRQILINVTTLLSLSAVFMLSGACSAEADLSASDETSITAGVESIIAAANRGDWQAWTDAYAENAVAMPPNSRPVIGRAALQRLLASLPPTSDWEYDVIDLDGRGDLAFLRGIFTVRMSLPGSEQPTTVSGSSMYIWRRQSDESWKVEREIWNSDDPPPMP